MVGPWPPIVEGKQIFCSCKDYKDGFLCGSSSSLFFIRESREGWLLLSAETEVNGDSKSTNERGPFLVVYLGLSVRYKRFLFRLGCSSQPSTKNFFLTIYTLFQFLCPHCPASWAGRAVLGRLSLSMCLCSLSVQMSNTTSLTSVL
jgi:hypothetical protein